MYKFRLIEPFTLSTHNNFYFFKQHSFKTSKYGFPLFFLLHFPYVIICLQHPHPISIPTVFTVLQTLLVSCLDYCTMSPHSLITPRFTLHNPAVASKLVFLTHFLLHTGFYSSPFSPEFLSLALKVFYTQPHLYF